MSRGRVAFVGCGPGAADLLTVRAVRTLEAADVIVWNASLLDRQALVAHTRTGVEIVEWPPATQREIDAVYERALDEGLLVVRLKGGDPTLHGGLEPELSGLRARAIPFEIVPGISALCAAGAAAGRELATPGAPLLVVDAGAVAAGTTGAPTVAAFGAGRDPRALQRALLGRGLPASTTCTVAIEVSRREELLLSCPLDELAETIEDMGLGVLTVVVAGPENRP